MSNALVSKTIPHIVALINKTLRHFIRLRLLASCIQYTSWRCTSELSSPKIIIIINHLHVWSSHVLTRFDLHLLSSYTFVMQADRNTTWFHLKLVSLDTSYPSISFNHTWFQLTSLRLTGRVRYFASLQFYSFDSMHTILGVWARCCSIMLMLCT